jgi:hypothetical protein
MAGTVNSQARREAAFQHTGLVGQRQLLGKPGVTLPARSGWRRSAAFRTVQLPGSSVVPTSGCVVRGQMLGRRMRPCYGAWTWPNPSVEQSASHVPVFF